MNHLLCVENGDMVKYAQLFRLASAWLVLSALTAKVTSVPGSDKGS